MKTLYKNAILIPMTDEKPYRGDILVDGTAIASIGREISAEGVTLVDCKGMFAIPGLIEAHAHIQGMDITGECHALELYVANGVTSLRNMWGNQATFPGMIEPDSKKAADDIEAGRLLGPTLVNTSRIFDGPEPVQDCSRTVTNEAMARYYVEEAMREGAGQLKVYEHITPEILDILYKLGREKGLKVVGHNPQLVEQAFFYERAFSLEHDISLAAGDVDLLAQYDTYWVPTAIVAHHMDEIVHKRYKKFLKTDLGQYLHPNTWAMTLMTTPTMYLYRDDDTMRNLNYKKTRKNIRRYYDMGREVAAGTDFPNPFLYPGFSLHTELEMLKGCGLTNHQVLRSATVMGSKVLELERRKGTLETGKDADIVFLRKNPLQNIKNTKTIERVVAHGRRFERKELDELIKKSVIQRD
jgi:imidazolonepropionase-like amidohydrolase